MALARSAQSHTETYDFYLQAGQHGISEGYHQAGFMRFKGYVDWNLDAAAELYEKAGDMGHLSSSRLAADIWRIFRQDHNKAKSLYLKQGLKGDPHGYMRLSKFYSNDSCQRKDILNKIEGIYSHSRGDNWFEEYFGSC